MEKFYRTLYGDNWNLFHIIFSFIIIGIGSGILKLINVDFLKLLSLINADTVSISLAMAGFVFAGASIFISMEGSKKMETITSIGKNNIIYSILIFSIVNFVISLLLMIIDINIFHFTAQSTTPLQTSIKQVCQWTSLYTLLMGFLYFFSSLKLIYWIFK